MLVLNIPIGKSLKIGDNTEVRLLSLSGEHVKIGVTAPREISVYREEIYNRIIRERKPT